MRFIESHSVISSYAHTSSYDNSEKKSSHRDVIGILHVAWRPL